MRAKERRPDGSTGSRGACRLGLLLRLLALNGAHERFDKLQYAGLLVARQLRQRGESFFSAADWAARLLDFRQLRGEEGSDGNLKDGGELFELGDRESDIATLPLGITLLGDAELLGDLGLGKPGLLAESMDTGTERTAV